MYEKRNQGPISGRAFAIRLGGHALVAGGVVLASLYGGMVGYHVLEKLPWRDAFLNAAMLLGGMGPVDAPQTAGGKVFAGLYALYAGLVFLIVAGVIFAPVIHRLLHRFHWEDPDRPEP